MYGDKHNQQTFQFLQNTILVFYLKKKNQYIKIINCCRLREALAFREGSLVQAGHYCGILNLCLRGIDVTLESAESAWEKWKIFPADGANNCHAKKEFIELILCDKWPKHERKF